MKYEDIQIKFANICKFCTFVKSSFQEAVWEIYLPVKYRKELEVDYPFSWIYLITILNNIKLWISVIFYLDKGIGNPFMYKRNNFLYICLNKYGHQKHRKAAFLFWKQEKR